ncbi:MAG: TrkH family potassium uptake protein [Coprobacillaceae bacterium]
MKETILNRRKEKHHMSPTRQIALSFLLVIFIGSLLLSLPISNNGISTDYINHLFTATSATCVTGLITVIPAEQYTIFGQIVVIILIQIGGLGFLTFLYLLYIKIRRKLSLNHKMVLQEVLNKDNLQDLPKMTKDIIKYTFVVEGIGALLLMLVFVPEYGAKGIYYGIFHSVSAFCNAGFDVLGSNSLIGYQTNIIITLVIPGLIILGGLGFIVWFNIRDVFKQERKRMKKFKLRHFLSKLSVHSKVVIVVTVILLVSGTVLFYISECNNPDTIGKLSFFDQLQVSFFQSATLRTAGFVSTDMMALRTSTKLMICIYMFIGGSPLGTAGGIKTVTFAIAMLMIYNTYRGNKELFVFHRRIKKRIIVRSFTIISMAIMIALSSLFVLSMTENKAFIDLCVEVFSAFATVGLTAGVTPDLSVIGKCIIMALMYIGRIGSITMLISIARKSHSKKHAVEIQYPDEDVILG